MAHIDVFADLIDTIYGLIRIMEEESETLANSGPCDAMGELAQAKIRLATRMDHLWARLMLGNAGWIEALDEEQRATFAEASEELHRAAVVNSSILERQINVSTELVQAVGKELERLTRRLGMTYCAMGTVRQAQASMPISFNQRY